MITRENLVFRSARILRGVGGDEPVVLRIVGDFLVLGVVDQVDVLGALRVVREAHVQRAVVLRRRQVQVVAVLRVALLVRRAPDEPLLQEPITSSSSEDIVSP